MWNLGAFGIIFDKQGGVLLCHRRDMDAWNLPGGVIEPGELPTEAAIREVKEETGLNVVIERLVGVYGKPDKPTSLVFSFLCRVTGGELDLTDESDDTRYFAINNIPPNTFPRQVERIHDALSQHAQPVFSRLKALSSYDYDVLKHL